MSSRFLDLDRCSHIIPLSWVLENLVEKERRLSEKTSQKLFNGRLVIFCEMEKDPPQSSPQQGSPPPAGRFQWIVPQGDDRVSWPGYDSKSKTYSNPFDTWYLKFFLSTHDRQAGGGRVQGGQAFLHRWCERDDSSLSG